MIFVIWGACSLREWKGGIERGDEGFDMDGDGTES